MIDVYQYSLFQLKLFQVKLRHCNKATKNLPSCFDVYIVNQLICQIRREISFKFLWPFQKSWTLCAKLSLLLFVIVNPTVIHRALIKKRPFTFVPALWRTVLRWCNENFGLLHYFQPISTGLLSCDWSKLNTVISLDWRRLERVPAYDGMSKSWKTLLKMA